MKKSKYLKQKEKVDKAIFGVFVGFVVVAVVLWFIADILKLTHEGNTPTYLPVIGGWTTRSFHMIMLGVFVVFFILLGIQTLRKKGLPLNLWVKTND